MKAYIDNQKITTRYDHTQKSGWIIKGVCILGTGALAFSQYAKYWRKRLETNMSRSYCIRKSVHRNLKYGIVYLIEMQTS